MCLSLVMSATGYVASHLQDRCYCVEVCPWPRSYFIYNSVVHGAAPTYLQMSTLRSASGGCFQLPRMQIPLDGKVSRVTSPLYRTVSHLICVKTAYQFQFVLIYKYKFIQRDLQTVQGLRLTQRQDAIRVNMLLHWKFSVKTAVRSRTTLIGLRLPESSCNVR